MLSETCARREFRAVCRRPVSPVRASQARSGALVHITGTAEGILFGSGLSLVGGPNDRCGTQHQSLRNDVSAPIVARGSSPTRTPSAFPLVQRAASHHRRASSAQFRARSLSSRPGACRAKLGIVVFSRVNRSPIAESWQPLKANSARPRDLDRGGEGCPLKERPEPAPPPGGAVQRAARRRCRRELLKRTPLADPARWVTGRRDVGRAPT